MHLLGAQRKRPDAHRGVICALSLCLGFSFPLPVAALSNAFTYQGQLQQSATPVNDNCDFQFSLWDAASGGSQIDSTQAVGGLSFYYDSVGNHCDLTSTAGWQCPLISDRNAKAELAAVDGRQILTRVAAMPIQTWRYKSQDASVRHIGPMAQDFHAAFEVGEDDKQINTVDANGVALAAIQGLYQLVKERDAALAALQQENTRLEARLTALEGEFTRSGSNVPCVTAFGHGADQP